MFPTQKIELTSVKNYTKTRRSKIHLALCAKLSNRIKKYYNWETGIANPYLNIPFASILTPFHLEFKKNFNKPTNLNISLKAKTRITFELLTQLSAVSAQTLHFEFVRFAKNSLNKSHTANTYRNFAAKISKAGLEPLFIKYPVLERLLCSTFLFYKRYFNKLTSRLLKDKNAIKLNFGKSAKNIIDISTNLSDPHNERQFVSVVKFENNFKLVYKPKSVQSEKKYNDLLKWLAQNTNTNFKTIKVLSKKGYGWSEFVQHKFCKNEKEIKNFYYLSGCILFIIFLLRGNDYHFENLVAHGKHPVLIDMETLFFAHPNKNYHKNKKLLFSALETDFIPIWLFNPTTGERFDVTAIGSRVNKVIPFNEFIWQNSNKNNINRVLKPKELTTYNLPFYNLEVLKKHDEEILNGFKYIYTFFEKNKIKLSKKTAPINQFANVELRHVIRPTRHYKNAIDKALSPVNLKDESTFLRQMAKHLTISLYKIPEKYAYQLIINELNAMWQLDIPLFRIHANGIHLFNLPMGGSIRYFKESGFSLYLKRLKSLSEKDLQEQLNIISESLHSNKYH